MHPLLFKIADPIYRLKRNLVPAYRADGLAVSNKNTAFLQDPVFDAAWRIAIAGNKEAWKGHVPDVRWRAHLACWAAITAQKLDGDFVECGVFTGLLSMTVLKYLQLRGKELTKKIFLFDTFNGIPVDGLRGDDLKSAEALNRETYFDCYEIAKRNFSQFPKAKLIRGALPETLDGSGLKKIAYLSIDLNSAQTEMQVIERLWPLLSPGAIILLDDYAFEGHDKQHSAWNDFAKENDFEIASLPTGQGLIVKHL